MDQANDIFEYEWWAAFIGYLILFVISIILLGTCCLVFQMVTTLGLLFWFGFFIVMIMWLFISILGLWTIRFVPKLVIFKQSSINVVFPLGQEKVFLYEDIRRIIILRSITKRNELLTTSWSRFRLRIYFSDNTSKVFLNPDRLVNFHILLERLKNKGLGSIIEQK